MGGLPPLLIPQGIVFLLWAGLAFKTLFHLLRRGQVRTGRMLPGPLTFLTVTRDWITDPAARRDRLVLGLVTATLLGLSVASAVLGPGRP